MRLLNTFNGLKFAQADFIYHSSFFVGSRIVWDIRNENTGWVQFMQNLHGVIGVLQLVVFIIKTLEYKVASKALTIFIIMLNIGMVLYV